MNLYAYCGNNSLNYADPSGCFKALIFRGYTEQQISDVMSGIAAVDWACTQRMKEIDAILDSPNGLGCTNHEPNANCARLQELWKLRDKLSRIHHMIVSDEMTMIFKLDDLGDKTGGNIVTNPVLTNRAIVTLNTSGAGPWIEGGPVNPPAMGEILMHEFSHLFGTEDDPDISWNISAQHFGLLFNTPLRRSQWYIWLENICLSDDTPQMPKYDNKGTRIIDEEYLEQTCPRHAPLKKRECPCTN